MYESYGKALNKSRESPESKWPAATQNWGESIFFYSQAVCVENPVGRWQSSYEEQCLHKVTSSRHSRSTRVMMRTPLNNYRDAEESPRGGDSYYKVVCCDIICTYSLKWPRSFRYHLNLTSFYKHTDSLSHLDFLEDTKMFIPIQNKTFFRNHLPFMTEVIYYVYT